MKQSDFRLGNYVKETITGRIGLIQAGIGSAKVRVKLEHSNITCPPELLAPVYLDTETLLKYSKCVNNVSKTYKVDLPNRNDVLFLSLREVGNAKPYIVNLFSMGTSKTIKEIFFLHELQNIVHCLTGVELQSVSDK